MWSKGKTAVLIAAWAIILLPAGRARAVDEEGCLFCHGLDIRAAAPEADGRDLRVREAIGGLHDALFCSDCHPDARRAPHAGPPGGAQCIGECHGQTAGAKESHRRASYGGLSEPHRGLSSPEAPCRLCHRATDRVGRRDQVLARCGSCHPREAESESRGVHARFADRQGSGMCSGCHPAHPSAPGGAKAACGGAGCHQQVTAGMTRLVGHKGTAAGGLAADAAMLGGFAVLGWIVGRRLSPRTSKEAAPP